ncbi:MAG: alpha/beta hydrolase, partial [Synergistetes bacterium]|nr:alpha/beta hydrolase [Synergistota bacterium]MDW8193188.1 alpha/beta hydrolase [Synergistota bacterium]
MRIKRFSIMTFTLFLTVILSSFVYGAGLDFDPNSGYTVQSATLDGKTIQYRAYTNIPYVTNPVLAWENGQLVNYQVMNIYIPVEYFEGKSINGYTAGTAPIYFINGVGGYRPAMPLSINPTATDNRTKSMLLALSKGFIVASPGARGWTLANQEGKYIGKAPAAIVDLKAAVRYLRYNDGRMPGDANKIIPTGVSAGGALTALLGATGNHPDYESYLTKLGA